MLLLSEHTDKEGIILCDNIKIIASIVASPIRQAKNFLSNMVKLGIIVKINNQYKIVKTPKLQIGERKSYNRN